MPERIILPRVQDVVRIVQHLWSLQSEDKVKENDFGMELIGADLSDAYCHFPVSKAAMGNCLAPAMDQYSVVCSLGLRQLRSSWVG